MDEIRTIVGRKQQRANEQRHHTNRLSRASAASTSLDRLTRPARPYPPPHRDFVPGGPIPPSPRRNRPPLGAAAVPIAARRIPIPTMALPHLRPRLHFRNSARRNFDSSGPLPQPPTTGRAYAETTSIWVPGSGLKRAAPSLSGPSSARRIFSPRSFADRITDGAIFPLRNISDADSLLGGRVHLARGNHKLAQTHKQQLILMSKGRRNLDVKRTKSKKQVATAAVLGASHPS